MASPRAPHSSSVRPVVKVIDVEWTRFAEAELLVRVHEGKPRVLYVPTPTSQGPAEPADDQEHDA